MCAAICQSCSMPLENDFILGTNEDGSKNRDYCNVCFRAGKFSNPNLTLEQEIKNVALHIKLTKRLPPEIALQITENTLPKLKRWRKDDVVEVKA